MKGEDGLESTFEAELVEGFMTCGGWCELVSLGVVSAGCQDGCEWPRECVFMGPEYKGSETKHGTWNQNP